MILILVGWGCGNSIIPLLMMFFCNFIACRIADLIDCQASFSSIKFRWDFFKESIKQKCITYCKEKRRYDSREHLLITNRLIQLKCDLVQGFNVFALSIPLKRIFWRLIRKLLRALNLGVVPVGWRKGRSPLVSFLRWRGNGLRRIL